MSCRLAAVVMQEVAVVAVQRVSAVEVNRVAATVRLTELQWWCDERSCSGGAINCRRWITSFHKAHRITGPNPASWISLVGSAAKHVSSTLEYF